MYKGIRFAEGVHTFLKHSKSHTLKISGFFKSRSASYASLKQYEQALEDANQTVTIKPDWAKVWIRNFSEISIIM